MSFPRYQKYKDSNVEWIGEVPDQWEVLPLKRSFYIVGGSTPKSETEEFWNGDILWATPSDLSKRNSVYINDTQRKITANGLASCGATLVPEASIILSTRAPIGSLAIAETAICTNQGCKSLVPYECTETTFFAHLLSISSAELNIRGKGTTFLEISGDELGAFNTPVPPRNEQAIIAEFLDRETLKIDALVAEQQRLIELLKEKRHAVISHAVTKGLNPHVPIKPSGIEWLGEVPRHWSVEPVGNRYNVQLGKMLDSTKITGNHLRPYLRVFDVQWGDINTDDLPQMDFDVYARSKFRLAAGDLLVNEGGSYPGRSAIWQGKIEECYYQKALHRMRPLRPDEDTTRFIYYVMFWAANQGVFVAGGNETTIEHLPAERLRKYRFAFPAITEQLAIASYLDSELAELDALIAEALRASDLLQERRTALISAAVTGQIDVRLTDNQTL